jgi:hypothetical protein
MKRETPTSCAKNNRVFAPMQWSEGGLGIREVQIRARLDQGCRERFVSL